jgi:hypothetical protein
MCVDQVTRYRSCDHTVATIKVCPEYHRLTVGLGLVAIMNNSSPAHCGTLKTMVALSADSNRCSLCAKTRKRELTSRSERRTAPILEPGQDGKQKSTSKTGKLSGCLSGAIRGLFGSSKSSKPRPVEDIRVLRETAQGTVPHLRMRDTRLDALPGRAQALRPQEQTAAEPRGRPRNRDAPSGGSRPAEASARSGAAPFLSARERRANQRADIRAPGPSPHEPQWPLTGQDRVPELVRSARVATRRPVVTNRPSEHSLRGQIGSVQDDSSSSASSDLPHPRPSGRGPPSGVPTRRAVPPNALPRRTTSKSSPSVASGSRTRPAVPPIRTTAFASFAHETGHYEFSGAELDPSINAFARETGRYEFSGAELDPSINPLVASDRAVSPVSPSPAPRRSVSPLSIRQPSIREPDHIRAERALRRQMVREQDRQSNVAPGGSHQVRLPVQPIVPPGYSGNHPAVPTPQRSTRTPSAAQNPVMPPALSRARDSMHPRPLQLRRVQGHANLQPFRPSEAASSSRPRYVPNPIFANQTSSNAPSQGGRPDGTGSGSVSRGLRRMFHMNNAEDDAEWVCRSSSKVERGNHRR